MRALLFFLFLGTAAGDAYSQSAPAAPAATESKNGVPSAPVDLSAWAERVRVAPCGGAQATNYFTDGGLAHFRWDPTGMYRQIPTGMGGGDQPVGPSQPRKLPNIFPTDIDVPALAAADPYQYAADELLKVLRQTAGFNALRALALTEREKKKTPLQVFKLRLDELRHLVTAQ